MARSRLAPELMKLPALYERAVGNLLMLEEPWPMSGHRRTFLARETRAIVAEIFSRGVQLSFGLEESGSQRVAER